ncbi:MAG TPA: serine hydrolase [Candidatus Udaeobacter sp.]|nr:serine hydrolase [Candidatus Udaeobacter sp.]
MGSTVLWKPAERGWHDDERARKIVTAVLAATHARFPDLQPGSLAITLVLPEARTAGGFSHRGDRPGYPASLVKLFFLAAAEAALESGRLAASRELGQALTAMIQRSGNDATSLVVDSLTGTTSGPALNPAALKRWLARRRAIDRYFAAWRCPEFAGINLAQKTWYEAPYGRERQSCFDVPNNRNRLTSDAIARLLLAIAQGEAVNRRRSAAMMKLLARFPDAVDAQDPLNQVTGFFGEGLPRQARLWSKAGWSSRTRHDAAIIVLPGGTRLILVAMSFGPAAARNRRLLPFIARQVARRIGNDGSRISRGR